MSLEARVRSGFAQRFGEAAVQVVRAPGRVNLIGEHTDYNDGFVLPMAIDRAAWIALRPRADSRVVVRSLDYDEEREFDLGELARGSAGWAEYVKGTAFVLLEAGYRLRGWDGVVAGDVPIGAGLSSSAALELATARAFSALCGLDWDPARMARLAQRAENTWVGVNCGIMDQLASAAGREGHALLIDCRSLAIRPVPLPAGASAVVLDTSTRRGLVGSAYNERREQCEAAAKAFGVRALRDVARERFEAGQGGLDPLVRKRARHVLTENERTLAAAEGMARGDARSLGRLMNESHESLRDDFSVSSDTLDAMVEAARASSGCFGARLTGAGFGGCVVALVEDARLAAFLREADRLYRERTGLVPSLYPCRAAAGASLA
jgi:galactokinase